VRQRRGRTTKVAKLYKTINKAQYRADFVVPLLHVRNSVQSTHFVRVCAMYETLRRDVLV
jgi:hypothetical protein